MIKKIFPTFMKRGDKVRVVLGFLGLLLFWATIIMTGMQQDTVVWLISAATSIVLMHLVSKWLKLGGLFRLGLQTNKGWLQLLLIGCCIGSAYQLVRFFIFMRLGVLSVHQASFDINSLVFSTVILLISTVYIGFAEEIVFRGYLLRLIPIAVSVRWMAVISATLFTLGHSVNAEFDIPRFIELFFVGLTFAVCYLATRSLWFVAGMHWFWDFWWFFLGADGGSSSAKLLETTKNSDIFVDPSWLDAGLSFGFFFFVLILMRFWGTKRIIVPLTEAS
jgi:membrane protease YdiL (CAAX protease family)